MPLPDGPKSPSMCWLWSVYLARRSVRLSSSKSHAEVRKQRIVLVRPVGPRCPIIETEVYLGCRPNSKVQRISDYRSKAELPNTLDRPSEEADSRPNRVPKLYR